MSAELNQHFIKAQQAREELREQKAREFIRLYGDHTTGDHFAPAVQDLSPEEIEALGGRTFKNVARDFDVEGT